ncbi:MAG: DMT family transporter [Chloroflexaceae bacterium]|jgi:drug/metabolite transporter (DMT)-like permease|nr:DMT family transporter [Chloroflexaceae bacterium]
MSLLAVGLVGLSALLHTAWNLLMKQAGERFVVTWWALLAGSMLFSPVLLWGWPFSAAVWPYAIGGALFQVAYFAALTYAYRVSDFSLVYPLARGAAPLLIALWASLFLGERVGLAGGLGLALVTGGLLLVGASGTLGLSRAQWPNVRGVAAALLVALCISGYSVVDGAAVRLVHPAPYTVLGTALTAALMTPLILHRYQRPLLLATLREQWRPILGIGVLVLLAYMCALAAYRIAPVSYVGAARELSIVVAALVGWLWLGERAGHMRVAGALVIVAGIGVLVLAG